MRPGIYLEFAHPSDLIDQNDGFRPETITKQVHKEKEKVDIWVPLPEPPTWLSQTFNSYTSYWSVVWTAPAKGLQGL